MIPRKAPTPSRNAPLPIVSRPAPTAPRDAPDLAQKNRTLEHTISRLRQELENTKDKHTSVRESYVRDAENMLGVNRILYLRAAAALEEERAQALRQAKEIRNGHIARIRRDLSITRFQAKETYLEARIDELEEKVEEREDESMGAVSRLEGKLAVVQAELERTRDLLRAAEKARDEAKADAARARKEQSTTSSNTSSFKKDLDRVTLQYEGAQTQVKDLQRKYEDAERTRAALQNQVDRWANLEQRGKTEVEELHKQRGELQDKVKELQRLLDAAQKKLNKGESSRTASELAELQKRTEELETTNAELQQEVDDLRNQSGDSTKSQRKINKLSQALSEQAEHRANAELRVKGLEKKLATLQTRSSTVPESTSSAEPVPSPPKTQLNPRPKPRTKPRAGSKQPQADSTAPDGDSDIQEIEPPPPVAKGKGKAPAPIAIDDDSESSRPQSNLEGFESEVVPLPSKKRKAKATDAEQKSKKRKKSDEGKEKPGGKSKGVMVRKASASTSKGKKSTNGSSEEEDDDILPREKKKMKKINPFASAQPAAPAAPWFGGGDGLIPTELSPIKQGAVPQRSANLRSSLVLGRRQG
ncbi:hypothetical protein K488DRAFT_91238 [Vararia minispora EC-137]|uniref:Uncharacterized protein n=1 Tax=Vararia minispora EC-137 TaxID=1314806 RepID=A0ACB8Q628_9AGAM|nr:hypothetical protein K488DRAFT_91238 [Vararia minispora EC-137]